jgi:hypothetical protein
VNKKRRTPLAWVILGILGALAATNVTFLILVRTGGPLIGLLFYLVLLTVMWRSRSPDYRPVLVGGVVGLVVHIVEIIFIGWTTYPLLMALNLILPVVLIPAAWLAAREI